MKKLLAWLMAVTLTFQLVTPVFAEEIEETQTATEAVEMETEAPTTEIPTTEPTTTDAMETAAPEETSAPTEPQPTTEVTEATETTASTEETTEADTEPTEPALDLLSEDGNVIASGTCGAQGDNLTWSLTNDGTLTISGNGEMSNYSNSTTGRDAAAPWSAYQEQIIMVVLESGVSSIGNYAFSNCAMSSVAIPQSVTSIGHSAFSKCTALTSITIPKGVQKIAGGTFYGCYSLESVVLPESLLSIDDRFGRGAFESCGLKSVTIPNSVTRIGSYAFSSCDELTSVIIPVGVRSIGSNAFSYCNSISSLTIPSSITEMETLAFCWCENLTSVEIQDGASTIGEWAFYGCYNLTNVTIPQSVTNIGSAAFYFCNNLSNVVIPKGITRIEYWSFSNCSSLTNVVIPEGVTNLGWDAFQDCSALTDVTIPESVISIEDACFDGCSNLSNVHYGGSKSKWLKVKIGSNNDNLTSATVLYDNEVDFPSCEIRPVDTTALISGSKLTLAVWAMPDNKKVKANWSLSEDSKAYASISSSGVLTAKAVSEVQNITVIATPTDGSPEARKEIQILPKITVKQAEKFNLFHSYSRAELAITGGTVDYALLDENKDFVLENENDHFYIRFADPENPPAKPNTRATLQVFFPGSDTPATKTLTISTTNTAPKLKLNPTSSILNTTLVDGLTVETEVLGTEDESLEARSATKGVTATVESGKLVVTLNSKKTTTATIYLKGNDWAKEVKLTHRITVTDKKPTVKFTAKGKLDVLNPASEIVYTPKLTNAAGTITDVQLTGGDAKLFNAEVVDGLVHLKLAESGENYSTKKTYKVMPIVTLLGKDITGPTLSVKVTQSAMKLAKIPNQTVSKSSPEDLTVNIKITSPVWADIDRMKLNDKSSAAFRDAFECFHFVGGAVTFPASTFAPLKPGRYTVILDVFPSNAAGDTKPIQAKFTLTVQK